MDVVEHRINEGRVKIKMLNGILWNKNIFK